MSDGSIVVREPPVGPDTRPVDNELLPGQGPGGTDLFRQRTRLAGAALHDLQDVSGGEAHVQDPETRGTLSARFGAVTLGDPVVIAVSTPVTVADPSPGMRVRLKWISLTLDADETPLRATVRWNDGVTPRPVYTWPIGRVPAFMHSVVREGAPDEVLEVILTAAGVPVVVNLDWEEIA